MPDFEYRTDIACPPGRVFDFVTHPANVSLVSPPDLPIELIDPPERLALGVQFTARIRRYGVTREIVSEVVTFDEGAGFTDRQVSGPFGKFVHARRLEPTADGTRMHDQIEYEAPGGLLGFVLTNARIKAELETTFAYRAKRFREILEKDAAVGR